MARPSLEQRTSQEVKALIERAARALGINASDFIVAAACREARATLDQCEMTRVGSDSARAFVDAFERDEPTPALVDLMRLHDRVKAARAETIPVR